MFWFRYFGKGKICLLFIFFLKCSHICDEIYFDFSGSIPNVESRNEDTNHCHPLIHFNRSRLEKQYGSYIYIYLGVLKQIKAQKHLKSEECRTLGNAEVRKLPSKPILTIQPRIL